MKLFINLVSNWAIPFMLLVIPLYGMFKKVPVYESFVEGAEEGLDTALQIIPYLVAMLVAISVFRASGAMDVICKALAPLLSPLGVPSEIMPLALMRPLSGTGVMALASELMKAQGPDSFLGRLASTLQGSTDTTFFILTVYFGSVGVKKYKYSIIIGLMADISGLIASVFICNRMFG
ncbi:MAG: spore maturation protein [Methylocystaceae bacterium]